MLPLLLLGAACCWCMLALARRRLRHRDPPVCVLSMDGGGTRGLVIAALLDEIEAQVGYPLAECFDLVCGSSTGGVAALHLVHGAQPTSAVAEYRASIERVRSRCLGRQSPARLVVDGHRCSRKGALSVARDSAAAMRRDDDGTPPRPAPGGTPHCFVVCSRQDCAGEWSPYLLRNYDGANGASAAGASDWTLEDSLRATTAAPTFLPPVMHSDGDPVVDGALVANNPSRLALAEARPPPPPDQHRSSLPHHHHRPSRAVDASSTYPGITVVLIHTPGACTVAWSPRVTPPLNRMRRAGRQGAEGIGGGAYASVLAEAADPHRGREWVER